MTEPQVNHGNMATCTCGHAYEEHGGDPVYPGSTACTIDDCDCIAFEDDGEDEDEE